MNSNSYSVTTYSLPCNTDSYYSVPNVLLVWASMNALRLCSSELDNDDDGCDACCVG